MTLRFTFCEKNVHSLKSKEGCHFMLPNLHCLFPFSRRKPSAPAHSLEEQLSALSILFHKSPVFFIAFIYYICKIYLSNDKFLLWAWSLKD